MNRLIVFTRYPEAGTTKTRTISVLGAEGAARLQRQLTEYTLKTVSQLQSNLDLSLAIYYSGGNLTLMQQWLGDNFDYYPQSQGDLGQKLQSALQDTYREAIARVVIIGIDCLDLTPAILKQAFASLEDSDLVIGPAADGGYYLIGLSGYFPELFENITWGTSVVFQQTKNIAQQLDLTISYLPILRDLDRPEDLQYLPPDIKLKGK